ncbi:MAG: alpha/beta hydrolase [Terracidiphilus sp.]|jgi:pimeloyl-ACP methyl ester carboxylesterase
MVEPRRSIRARTVRVTKRVLLFILVVVVVLLGAGTIWNAVALHHYRSLAGIPGKIYQVDGHGMQMLCTGSGSPVVVLEAGLGNDSTIWAKNQPALSKVTRVCAYDRAGFGWSESVPGVRDSNAISHELHGLLEQAGITDPVILMGHSIAGIHMRKYAAQYPQQVAGIVFIDGSTPQQDKYFPASIEKKQAQFVKILFPLVEVATVTGVLRAMGQCTEVAPGAESYAAWIKADTCMPSQIISVEREMKAVPASGDESVHTGPFGDMPLLIFSQDPTMHDSRLGDEGGKQLSVIWNGMQENLKKLSTNSRRIIAKGSTHYVQVDRSDMLNSEVTKFIEQVRSGTVSPQNGTTVTE